MLLSQHLLADIRRCVVSNQDISFRKSLLIHLIERLAKFEELYTAGRPLPVRPDSSSSSELMAPIKIINGYDLIAIIHINIDKILGGNQALGS